MAMNPMQRKANTYLIIGVLVTLLITGTIIAILAMQFIKLQDQIKKDKNALKTVYVTAGTIKSGELIKEENFKTITVSKNYIPANIIDINALYEDAIINGEITQVPKYIAKIDLQENIFVTQDMLSERTDKTTDDLRIQEYNMIELPTQLQSGEYIDIRLRLENGVDCIVVSKKKIEIPTINGIDSENTIWLKLNEAETETMSCAIVESYMMSASKLYATRYVEPGNQKEATITYVPNEKVQTILYSNPNIAQEAKAALSQKYNAVAKVREYVNGSTSEKQQEELRQLIQGKTQEEINKAVTERQKYLESLGAY